jgi:hypothetical protein
VNYNDARATGNSEGYQEKPSLQEGKTMVVKKETLVETEVNHRS